MWIRNQNKNAIGDYKEIISTGTSVFGYASMGDDSTMLGEYKTEKRTIEVLDMIQSRIVRGTRFDELFDGKRTTRDFVFNMPQK